MNITEIKARLESSTQFQHFQKEDGISWDDFEVIDLTDCKVIKQGSKEIGNYTIFINGNKLSVSYDLTVDSLRDRNLARIKKQ